jgi:hypothetical protein
MCDPEGPKHDAQRRVLEDDDVWEADDGSGGGDGSSTDRPGAERTALTREWNTRRSQFFNVCI